MSIGNSYSYYDHSSAIVHQPYSFMEQASVTKKPFTVPDLIIRIGAGTPIVSNSYLYYFARTETPPAEDDSQARRSISEPVSPSQMPLPSTPHSQPGSVVDLEAGEVIRSSWESYRSESPTDLPTPRPRAPVGAMSSDGGSQGTGSRSETMSGSDRDSNEDERMDLSPCLPRNPSVTPADPTEHMPRSQCGSILDVVLTDGEHDEGSGKPRHVRKDISDYFSIPTSVILHPGTPGAGHDRTMVADPETLKPNRRLLMTPDSRPNSMLVNIDDVPWMSETAVDQAGPDPFLDDREPRPEDVTPPAGFQPFPNFAALVRPADYQSDGAKDAVRTNGEVAKNPNMRQHISFPDPIPMVGPGNAASAMRNDRAGSIPGLNPFERPSQDGLDDPPPEDNMRELEPQPYTGPSVYRVGKRKKFVRRARNAALRPIVLRVILGRELAGPTKYALRTLARGEELPVDAET